MCNYESLGKLNPNVSKYKFVQIMPAPENLYVELKDEQGKFYSPIVCMALKNNGEIVYCDSSSTGEIHETTHTGMIKKYNPDTESYEDI
ncbi:hypothetical protein MUA31_11255 [Staphylococcus simulans]|uniref:hypothetical protein n=1 Tax=Staphylococcus simulans TaxID=1286 RepID=UPI0021CF8914|nr:hypothetical protein [Staphylococcus simulans]UXR34944.1 hypothetical protein MUA31_11255 [Staphylococcus simulans]